MCCHFTSIVPWNDEIHIQCDTRRSGQIRRMVVILIAKVIPFPEMVPLSENVICGLKQSYSLKWSQKHQAYINMLNYI